MGGGAAWPDGRNYYLWILESVAPTGLLRLLACVPMILKVVWASAMANSMRILFGGSLEPPKHSQDIENDITAQQ